VRPQRHQSNQTAQVLLGVDSVQPTQNSRALKPLACHAATRCDHSDALAIHTNMRARGPASYTGA
jgi:hypothetical protein